MSRVALILLFVLLAACSSALAQERFPGYVGGLFGVSTLSADGRSVIVPPGASVSLYKPENGAALNVFFGAHLGRYFSVQANYIWNRNDLTLISTSVSSGGGAFYEQRRTSTQHALVADALLYFRSTDNRVRPYLSTGVGLVRLASEERAGAIVNGLAPPANDFRSSRAGLRVAVGIDLQMTRGWSFRYSFSETISGNPISERLTPPGRRGLANFQNLFGVVREF